MNHIIGMNNWCIQSATVHLVSASYWKLIDAGLLPCNLIISPADASMDVTIFTQMEWRWLLLTAAIYQ